VRPADNVHTASTLNVQCCKRASGRIGSGRWKQLPVEHIKLCARDKTVTVGISSAEQPPDFKQRS
jgi:hypothetical protein